MCFGGKSKSTPAPAPAPTVYAPMPADYSNANQRGQAVAASTNSQLPKQGDASFGSSLSGTATATNTGGM